ncbi:MAG: DNA methyltransferase [Candidatus Thorarchaeota archaeon]
MEQSKVSDFDPQNEEVSDDWTFAGVSTNYMTHGLHPYPARMIPQIARKLILRYSKEGNTVWDPFCGSGSALVESMLTGRKSVGTDLNPFAIFLSKVKTTPIDSAVLRNAGRGIVDRVMALEDSDEEAPIPAMHNIDYWFKEYVQRDLARVLKIVNEVEEEDLRDFFRLCFASATREVSNLKKREFKIVRMRKEKLDAFSPEVKPVFVKHVQRCIPLMESFYTYLSKMEILIPAVIEVDNRFTSIESGSIDLVVTSPPYGDSGTTVAYGQFSKYPALWIGLDREDVRSIDKRCLGGLNNHDHSESDFESKNLVQTYQLVKANSEKRAKQFLGFFNDLNESLLAMYDKLRNGTRACIVVGNRLMSRVRIPTHTIIEELGGVIGFELDKTIPRMIPTKRMPWQNAPENVEGEKADTMHTENIVILVKP